MLQALAELVDVERCVPTIQGPRVWWNGQLDVEGLALESVLCAAAVANAISPGCIKTVRSDVVAANFASIAHLRIDGRPATGFAPMSGFFACDDGWLRTHANFPHHAAALTQALGAKDRDGLAQTLSGLAAEDAERMICAAGGVAAALRSQTEWQQSQPGRAVAREPWTRWEPGVQEREPQLVGLRVLDFTRVIAGPTATKFLAALGADVLRIDPPSMPELLDQHLDTGAGKRSAVADLGQPEVLHRVHELVATADVVMLGYRPGALARFGLGPEELYAAHPRLAVVHLDAWGDRGPLSGQRGFDSIVQAATGIADIYRAGDGYPGALPVQALDHATGYGAAAAALALTATGGIAHLSLANTAQQLIGRRKPSGEKIDLPVATCDIQSPHGDLRQIIPLVGAPRPPGRYGASRLEWR